MAKPSFFEKLTGANVYEPEEEPRELKLGSKHGSKHGGKVSARNDDWTDEGEGQLTVDVYQTPEDIMIKTMVAGVRPEDLDIAITRDMVTIKGSREVTHEVNEGSYFTKELYWGTFSRTITLPEEIDVEGAEASEKHGLLTIKLPKLDKHRETKLRVKTS